MKWEYESDTFYWFPTPRLYKPDFKIFKEDGSHYYIETKGFFDPESRAKMAAIKKQVSRRRHTNDIHGPQ